MERAAVYRRALAPIMLLLGGLGTIAGAGGWMMGIDSPKSFCWYWLAISFAGICGAYTMARRQALREAEAFWSPPTRRVTQAALPSVFVGLTTCVWTILSEADPAWMQTLCVLWMALYGCALHAAGFFMPRGMKLFGWIFILSACLMAGIFEITGDLPPVVASLIMGLCFGGFHLAYGVYLYFSEPRTNEV